MNEILYLPAGKCSTGGSLIPSPFLSPVFDCLLQGIKIGDESSKTLYTLVGTLPKPFIISAVALQKRPPYCL